MNAVKEYDARLDTKKRVTIRGAHYDHYHVIEYPNGKIILEPRELVAPFEVSKRSLAMMDEAVAQYKNGVVSGPVDLSAFADTN
ncbi:MAG: hypothetical protein A2087_01590 [Spirochaetes bacterium GWD1_61_31]|nr:MAG: hypothetical protein A2Y37_12490 [Spirochaetes bacterium GWB1_60_80]OHD30187.1 MAG: hypothetical protein A2004_14355 [Spirochaetes bacterium GWC1_61_12]OHD35886.1 MAG: hypothetical protein A2087_01590 [Spirochaetes bacterium GWD1_61_31]OHD42153.1 MAG: hypothetical protein A2Y35_06445 [Spirochaetes bacterium GWE1_60_18]OHD59429.1 MAG: hypothetical protein A2Y32_09885 [Spirochaetes bacterium GWF1_60_12]HAP44059.1 hypothetical protein [Spirochaetaceae bacterium]